MKTMAFDVEVDGRPVSVVVRPPSPAVSRQGDLAHRRGFQSAVAKGAQTFRKLKPRIDSFWGPTQQAESERLWSVICADEALLAEPRLGVAEGRLVAERLRRTRAVFDELRRPWLDLQEASAEMQALKARIDFLIASCTFHRDGARYFPDAMTFTRLREQGHPVALRAYWAFTGAVFGWREDVVDARPEAVFLRLHGLAAHAA